MASRIGFAPRVGVEARWGTMAGGAFVLLSAMTAPARAADEPTSAAPSRPGVTDHAVDSAALDAMRPDEPSVTSAFVTGAAIAGISLALGGAVAVGADSDTGKAAGIYGVQAGLVMAPLAAHAMLGEYKRGVLFAVPPFAAMLGMAAVLQTRPHTVSGGPAAYQYAFTSAMTLSILSSILGVSDVLSFHDRNGAASVAVLPEVGQERIGIRIGGRL